jgi:hypothetical protein
MSSGVTKDTRGEAVSSDGGTEMAIPSMVATVQSNGKEDSGAGRLASRIEARVINDGKPCDVEITTRCDANGMGDSDWVMSSKYGWQVWNTIRGDKHKVAMVFILNIFCIASVGEDTLNTWIGGLKEGAMKSRLHGWLLWAEYCRTKGISISAIQDEKNPAVMVADFVCFMYLEGASNTWRREAMAVVYELLGTLRSDAVGVPTASTNRRLPTRHASWVDERKGFPRVGVV